VTVWFVAGTMRCAALALIEVGQRLYRLAGWVDPKPLIELGPGGWPRRTR
jgi:hypothetical protein